MNKYIFVLIVCTVVFLICFLIDTLFKVIFPKSKLEKSKQVVRPPRKSAVAGVILTFAGVAVLIKNLAGTPDTLFLIGSIVAIIFGVILLCTYFSVVIYFDDEGFLYKAWGHGKKEFRYSQIRGQRSLLTRGEHDPFCRRRGDQSLQRHAEPERISQQGVFQMVRRKGHRPGHHRKQPPYGDLFPRPG